MQTQDLRELFARLSQGDPSTIDGMLTEDVVLEFPGTRFGGVQEGRRRVSVFFRQNQRLFRDGLTFTVHWAGVLGDRGVVQWTNAGTTRAGQPYANRGVTVFHLRDTPEGLRIARIEDYLDTELLAETWPR